MSKNGGKNNPTFDKIQTTTDTLTSRGGLALFSRFLDRINIHPRLETLFGSVRKHDKGISVTEAFHQALCYFMDGTCLSLKQFDRLAEEEGYARTIESNPGQMASSHQMKRFWGNFSFRNNHQFRRVLQDLFLWQINQTRPDLLRLDLDTMILDNNHAENREGVEATYKNVKGYKPLQLKYNGRVIDFVFRGGDKHCNNGDTVVKMVRHLLKRVRAEYDREVLIILTADNAFFDRANFRAFEELGIGYVVGGKKYQDIKYKADQQPKKDWKRINKPYMNQARGEVTYRITSFLDRRGSWEKKRRALFCRLVSSEGQKKLGYRETVYYTNLGTNEKITRKLEHIGEGEWIRKEGLLDLAHTRGRSELIHRDIKEFGTEHLPFKRFEANHAFYGTMLVAHSLYCCFAEQITGEVVKPECYPNTFRRQFLDVAGKVVDTGREVILKVTEAVFDRLKLDEIWERVNSPPVASLC